MLDWSFLCEHIWCYIMYLNHKINMSLQSLGFIVYYLFAILNIVQNHQNLTFSADPLHKSWEFSIFMPAIHQTI